MGACASVVKGMKGEAGTVPPPEPVKEESSEVTEVIKGSDQEVKVELQEEENKAEDAVDEKEHVKMVDENIKNDGEKVDDNKLSLGALLNKSEEAKKESTEDEKTASEAIPSEIVNQQEPKTVKTVVEVEKPSIVAGPQEVGKTADKATEVKEE